MKANSKRRVLISSLAMLMVALVALSTATYAWFTSSTTATASGINVKTVKSSELVISKSDKDWKTLVDYGVANKVLLPTSTDNGTSWFSAEAEIKTAFDKKTGTDFAGVTDGSNYYFAEELNVMNKGEATVENVKISFSGLTNKYARVAIVEADANGNITGTFTDSVYDVDGAAYDAANSATATTSITPKTTYTINVGNLAHNDAKYYNIYVWFEGQDVDCFDGTAGQAIDDITFTVTGETEDQI